MELIQMRLMAHAYRTWTWLQRLLLYVLAGTTGRYYWPACGGHNVPQISRRIPEEIKRRDWDEASKPFRSIPHLVCVCVCVCVFECQVITYLLSTVFLKTSAHTGPITTSTCDQSFVSSHRLCIQLTLKRLPP